MARGAVARRYARAVFEIALSQDRLLEWQRELGVMRGEVGQPGFRAVIGNREMSVDAKRDFVDNVLGSEMSQYAKNLLHVLIQRGRLDALDDIVAEFDGLVDQHMGIATAEVTTAVEMSDFERQRVSEQLAEITGKQIRLRCHVDPSIVGGLVARIGDKVLDGSTRSRLVALRQRLAG